MIDDSLDAIRANSWYRGQILHVAREPGADARHGRPSSPLPDGVARYLEHEGIELYCHQAQAVDAWREGRDVLIATRTASGKSLAFNCCVAEALADDPKATALYLYPTKALAHDQLEHLTAFDEAVGLCAKPAAYDGDTPSSARARIRRESRLIVTNPYGLHEYLPQPEAFQRFLSRLAVVVIDEAHRYRGIFGSNVALVLRRLQRIAERLGAAPRFVLASGTIANPAEHGAHLIGRPVEVVDDDGGPHGPRAVALFDATVDPDRSMGVQAAEVVASLVGAGRSTICFTGSRVLTELVARWASEIAPKSRISAYRAGYLPAERRQIEQQLRAGSLDAVVSTNALELGIDIGGLDAVVMAGYPGTIASTWQQIGRAGRAQRPALAVLVAGEDPLDSYVVRRPETLFGSPVERAVVALDNPEVLTGQVLCAAAEMPVRASESPSFGSALEGVLEDLRDEGLVAAVPAGLAFVGTFRPASAVKLDGRSDGAVELRVAGQVLEVLDSWRAMRYAHRGAVFLHRGETFRINRLDLEARIAEAEPFDAPEHTRAVVVRSHEVDAPERERTLGAWKVGLGAARVRSQVVAYKLFSRDEPVSMHPLELPQVALETRGLFLVPAVALGDLLAAGNDPLGALHAAEHALIHAMPLLAMCDREDAGGASMLLEPVRACPMILVYDGYEGGSGIVDTAYEHLEELVDITVDMLASCDCELGCPRCVFDRDCGSGNSDLDRPGALAVLRSLRSSELRLPPAAALFHDPVSPRGGAE